MPIPTPSRQWASVVPLKVAVPSRTGCLQNHPGMKYRALAHIDQDPLAFLLALKHKAIR
jgi:hypothetical protein